MKKLAPYGRHLKEMLENDQLPLNDVYLFIGDHAWQTGKEWTLMRPTTLILPPHQNPHYFYWPVKNCDVLIFDTSSSNLETIEQLVIILFAYQANIVRFISTNNLLTVFKKDL